jgi:hypothetical protein
LVREGLERRRAGVVITTTRISTSVAATDIITVASAPGVNNTHYVEFVQLDGAGEMPTLVDHPTYIQADPIGYGVKVMELSRALSCPGEGLLHLVRLCRDELDLVLHGVCSHGYGWTRCLAGPSAHQANQQHRHGDRARHG